MLYRFPIVDGLLCMGTLKQIVVFVFCFVNRIACVLEHLSFFLNLTCIDK